MSFYEHDGECGSHGNSVYISVVMLGMDGVLSQGLIQDFFYGGGGC